MLKWVNPNIHEKHDVSTLNRSQWMPIIKEYPKHQSTGSITKSMHTLSIKLIDIK